MDGFVFFAFLFSVAWIVGIFWVVADASANSSQSALLWGLVAFFGGILGILLYVLLGRDGGGTSRSGGRGGRAGRSDGHGGGRGSGTDRSRGRPSHVCQSCGEEYFTRSSTDIDTCRSCGGIRVEKA